MKIFNFYNLKNLHILHGQIFVMQCRNKHQGDLAKHMYPQLKKITSICIRWWVFCLLLSMIDKTYDREIQIFARICSIWNYLLERNSLNVENGRFKMSHFKQIMTGVPLFSGAPCMPIEQFCKNCHCT